MKGREFGQFQSVGIFMITWRKSCGPNGKGVMTNEKDFGLPSPPLSNQGNAGIVGSVPSKSASGWCFLMAS